MAFFVINSTGKKIVLFSSKGDISPQEISANRKGEGNVSSLYDRVKLYNKSTYKKLPALNGYSRIEIFYDDATGFSFELL